MNSALPRLALLLMTAFTFSLDAQAADGHRIKQRADAVLTLMSFMIVPDITASDLNIGSGSDDKSELAITQFGGGATMGESFPAVSRRGVGLQPIRPAVRH
ncbi:Uncharacterised protein [Kluyvera cryocrescens]|uniref:Uncharacterized protein n=1 Tax=Kluyvera cryocrescens TaxID=580 RepID=A0A485CYU9_KLUCR|nr:Uncharacterised protein [Kluyvera cryocrescens]